MHVNHTPPRIHIAGSSLPPKQIAMAFLLDTQQYPLEGIAPKMSRCETCQGGIQKHSWMIEIYATCHPSRGVDGWRFADNVVYEGGPWLEDPPAP